MSDRGQETKVIFHAIIPLASVEKMVDDGGFWLTENGRKLTPAETTARVLDLQMKGLKYLPTCDNTDKEGKCLGHKE